MTSDDAVNQLGLLAMTGKSQRIFSTPPRELSYSTPVSPVTVPYALLLAYRAADLTTPFLSAFERARPGLDSSASLYCLVHQQHDDYRQILSRAISPRQLSGLKYWEATDPTA